MDEHQKNLENHSKESTLTYMLTKTLMVPQLAEKITLHWYITTIIDIHDFVIEHNRAIDIAPNTAANIRLIFLRWRPRSKVHKIE